MGDINLRKKHERIFFNKEYEICLKAFHEWDIIPGIKPYYAQLFMMSGQLVKENDKQREHILGFEESLKDPKEVNNSFKMKITKIRRSRKERKWCDSLIGEIINLYGTPGKVYPREKEDWPDLIKLNILNK